MKCSKCSGAGYIYNNLVGYAEDCSVCHGKGEVQTNEEWFCGLSTDEKAKWLNQQLMYAAAAREQGYFTVDGLIKWLKEKHE